MKYKHPNSFWIRKFLQLYNYYFLKVNNKSKWIGQDICYHQEYAISKYMGLKDDDSIQIFLALEPHTLENGCLKLKQTAASVQK